MSDCRVDADGDACIGQCDERHARQVGRARGSGRKITPFRSSEARTGSRSRAVRSRRESRDEIGRCCSVGGSSIESRCNQGAQQNVVVPVNVTLPLCIPPWAGQLAVQVSDLATRFPGAVMLPEQLPVSTSCRVEPVVVQLRPDRNVRVPVQVDVAEPQEQALQARVSSKP